MISERLKADYKDSLQPPPAWPMTPERAGAIYRTMARSIRQASDRDKQALVVALLAIAESFDSNSRALTSGGQEEYDRWFFQQIDTLLEIPFGWLDRRSAPHETLEFGLAQKFVNLTLKDWWCLCSGDDSARWAVLHALFDNYVWDELHRIWRTDFRSLDQGGYYVHLSREDYASYQSMLGNLGRQLGIARVDMEQVLWNLHIRRRKKQLHPILQGAMPPNWLVRKTSPLDNEHASAIAQLWQHAQPGDEIWSYAERVPHGVNAGEIGQALVRDGIPVCRVPLAIR